MWLLLVLGLGLSRKWTRGLRGEYWQSGEEKITFCVCNETVFALLGSTDVIASFRGLRNGRQEGFDGTPALPLGSRY